MKRGLLVLLIAAFFSACASNGNVTPSSAAAQSGVNSKKPSEVVDGKAQTKSCFEESAQLGSKIKKRRRCASAGEVGGK